MMWVECRGDGRRQKCVGQVGRYLLDLGGYGMIRDEGFRFQSLSLCIAHEKDQGRRVTGKRVQNLKVVMVDTGTEDRISNRLKAV